jgi:Ca2+-binding RTX toxin-like protein
LIGTIGNNTLGGAWGDDQLFGGAGQDYLLGSFGLDMLDGGVGDDTLEGGGGNDVLIGGAGYDVLNGGDDIDTASYVTSLVGVTVSLALTTAQVSTGDASGDVLSGIENLTGSSSADTLIGDSGANVLDGAIGNDTLIGGAGNDTLIGGDGIDTADYSAYANGITVNLSRGYQFTGDVVEDRLYGVENVIGTAFDDYLSGSADTNVIVGGAGNDQLDGGDGNDTLDGGADNDTLYGGAGADTLIGGDGIDTVSYESASAGVIGNLNGFNTDGPAAGDGAGDNIVGVENLIGSSYGDTLYGNSGANIIYGRDGSDYIIALAGDDTIYGEGDNDSIVGGLGADTIYGGDGIDSVSFRQSYGVNVDLLTGVGLGGDAQGDTYNGIENIFASDFDDVLKGDAGSNFVFGYSGNDIIEGGIGADYMYGDAGIDTASYSGSSAGVTVDMSVVNSAQTSGGDASGDYLTGFENLLGSAYNDTLTGDNNANTIEGGAGSDNLSGGSGDGDDFDTVSYKNSGQGVTVDLNLTTAQVSTGDASGDILFGFENITGSTFNDVLTGYRYSLNGVIDGGFGDDTLFGSDNADIFIGGSGFDTVNYSNATTGIMLTFLAGQNSSGAATGDSFSGIEKIIGTNFNDTFIGGTADQIIDGGAGGDTFYGNTATNIFIGGADTDFVWYLNGGVNINLAIGTANGGDATGDSLASIEGVFAIFGSGSTMIGGDENNYFWGSQTGNDTLIGAGGTDTLNGGGGGTDYLDGGAGNDAIYLGAGADTVFGGTGYDFIVVGGLGDVNINLATGIGLGGNAQGDLYFGVEEVTASSGNDTLVGDAADNGLFGQDGNDLLEGGLGADLLYGGAGIDAASYAGSSVGVTVTLGLYEQISTGDANGDRLANIENLTGSAYNDTLIGDAGDNVLSGGGGDDTLIGGAGTDSYIGGSGFDTVSYATSTAALQIYLDSPSANQGDAFGENFISIENFIGTSFNDAFFGDANSHVFDGGAGNDGFVASTGKEVFVGGTGSDSLYFYGSSAGVTVDLAAGEGHGGLAEGDIFTGIEAVYGSLFDDVLIGDAGDNGLTGWDGNDIIYGGAGVDNLNGKLGNDTLSGGAGADNLWGDEGNDTASYIGSSAGVTVDLNITSTVQNSAGDAAGDFLNSVENITGSSFSDTLTGDAGHNTLSGEAGADTLTGNAGNDTLIGGLGDDTFVFSIGFGNDTINDFGSGTGVGDLMQLSLGAAFDTYGEVMAAATQIGADTVIAFDASNSVTLSNVLLTSLLADDFVFV